MTRLESGQVAIAIFIVLMVGLTIGMGLATRALRDFQSSGQTDFSSRAYTAAEAGVEDILRQGPHSVTSGTWFYSTSSAYPTGTTQFTSSNPARTLYQVKVDDINNPTFTLQQDKSSVLALNISGNNYYYGPIYIFWGSVTDTTPADSSGENVNGSRPVLEITLLAHDSKQNYTATKLGLNPDTTRTNNLVNPGASNVRIGSLTSTVTNSSGPNSAGQNDLLAYSPNDAGKFTNVAILNLANADNIEYVLIKALYNHATIGIEDGNYKVSGAKQLPTQSFVITSQGLAGNPNQAGSATRVVQVTKGLPTIPSIFDYVLYSGGTGGVNP